MGAQSGLWQPHLYDTEMMVKFTTYWLVSAERLGGHNIKSTRNNTWIALRVVPADDDDQPGLRAPTTAGNRLYVEFTDVLLDWNFTCSPFDRASGSPESSLHRDYGRRKHVPDWRYVTPQSWRYSPRLWRTSWGKR